MAAAAVALPDKPPPPFMRLPPPLPDAASLHPHGYSVLSPGEPLPKEPDYDVLAATAVATPRMQRATSREGDPLANVSTESDSPVVRRTSAFALHHLISLPPSAHRETSAPMDPVTCYWYNGVIALKARFEDVIVAHDQVRPGRAYKFMAKQFDHPMTLELYYTIHCLLWTPSGEPVNKLPLRDESVTTYCQTPFKEEYSLIRYGPPIIKIAFTHDSDAETFKRLGYGSYSHHSSRYNTYKLEHTATKIQESLTNIFETYERDINSARSEEEVIHAIATLFMHLEWLQPVQWKGYEAFCRRTNFATLNFLLAQNGFPCIKAPKFFAFVDGEFTSMLNILSVDAVVDMIKKGLGKA